MMLTFGECPNCGARKRDPLSPQAVRQGATVFGALAIAMFFLVGLLMAAGFVVQVAKWLFDL